MAGTISNPIWNKNFILLFVGNMLMSMAFYFLIPVLPVYLETYLHSANSMIGIVLSAYTIAALLVRPLAGNAVDRYGRRNIYLYAFALFSILFAGYAIASSTNMMIVLRFMHGLMWGILTTSSAAIIVDILPADRRGEGLGHFGVSMTMSMALGPMIGLYIQEHFGYHAMFYSATALSLAGFIIITQIKFSPFLRRPSVAFRLSAFFEKSSFAVSTAMLVLMISYGAVLTFIVLYAKEIHIANPGLFFVVYALSLGLMRIISGKIFDRKGPAIISILGFVLLLCGFPVLSLIQNIYGYTCAAVLLGSGFGIVFPVFQAMVNNLAKPQNRGIANSTLFTAVDLGIGIGMISAGYLADITGKAMVFLLCTLIVVAAGLVYGVYALRHYNMNK